MRLHCHFDHAEWYPNLKRVATIVEGNKFVEDTVDEENPAIDFVAEFSVVYSFHHPNCLSPCYLHSLHMIFAAERNRRRFAAAEWPDSSNGMQLTWKNKRVVVVVVVVVVAVAATATSANIHIPYPSCILWFLDASSSPLQTLVPRGECNHFPTLPGGTVSFIPIFTLGLLCVFFNMCFFYYPDQFILVICNMIFTGGTKNPLQKSERNAAV